MKEYTIEIVIGPDGKLLAETGGVTGPACVDELGGILSKLEGARKEVETDDYYNESPQAVRMTVRTGGDE